MLSSKKIMYFVILSAMMLCFLQGIDFMANEAMAATVVEIPTFAESGFSRLPEINTVDDEDGNTAVAEPDATAPSSTVTTGTTESTAPTEAIDITTEPVVSVTDVSDPTADPTADGSTEEQDTTGTTTSTTAPTATTTQTTTFMTTTLQTTTLQTTTLQTTAGTTLVTTQSYEPVFTTTTTIATTTSTTTTAPTTLATQYTDSGSISFNVYDVTVYSGQSATNAVRIPIGVQKRISFSSMTPSVVSVTALNDTTAYITGIASGVGWVQGRSLSGDVCYCRVTVIDFTDEVLRLTNDQRRMYGLPDLMPGTDLMDYIANVRLSESQTYFSHTRPNGQKFEYAAIDAGLDYYRVGENLACGQLTPQAVVNAWMNSPTHRANILDSGFERLSVAYGIGPDGATYWVQFFWQPH